MLSNRPGWPISPMKQNHPSLFFHPMTDFEKCSLIDWRFYMTTYRVTTTQDIPQLRCLWQTCFGDTDSFLDFFFGQRFVPNLSVCTEVDGVIVGAIFGLPTQMKVRNQWVTSSMSSGFCTHPDHRGKGYFTHLFSLYMANLRENDIVLAINTPVRHEGYFPLEQRTLTDSQKLSGIATTTKAVESIPWDVGNLWKIYNIFSTDYTNILWRSYRDMALRLDDIFADGGQVLAVEGGYALYYNGPESLTAVELVGKKSVYQDLVDGLCHMAQGKPVSMKLPPDVEVTAPGLTSEIYPQGVGGIVDISKLLSQIPVNLSLEITDPVCPWNNITLGKGPKATLSSGRFLQYLTGYVNYDLPDFQKEICFIPDEY